MTPRDDWPTAEDLDAMAAYYAEADDGRYMGAVGVARCGNPDDRPADEEGAK